MCQEVGHTLGLGHTSEDGSSQNTCMDYFSNTGANATSTQSTEPNQHDYDQLALIYGHLDSTTTLKSTTAAIARGGPTGADGDGTPADASRARGSWYVETSAADATSSRTSAGSTDSTAQHSTARHGTALSRRRPRRRRRGLSHSRGG